MILNCFFLEVGRTKNLRIKMHHKIQSIVIFQGHQIFRNKFGESIFNPYWGNVTCTARLVKREEGYFITGRGCGLSTPMKYLKDIPEILDDYKCSFIPIKTKVGFCSNDIEFKFINTPTGKFLAWWNLPIKSLAHGIV